MDDRYYKQLVSRYLAGNATDDELEVFAHLVKEGKLDVYLNEAINVEAGIHADDEISTERDNKKSFVFAAWLKYAAAVILMASASVIVYSHFTHLNKPVAVTRVIKNDALPGGNRAILTLANGKKIVLGNAGNGTIALQGNTQVDKIRNGQLVYQATGSSDKWQNATANQVTYNTVSTPKAGEYEITLPDGTKIWLNSVSSITFPTAFTGNERRVSITGEVYFEVAKNKNKPFIVETRGQNVTVLGTHFNINAYDDENTIKTTLLEGSIKLSAHSNSKILTPGQQAEVTNNRITIINNSDTEAAVAWKNGYFVFDNTDLPTLMRQLSRWYDVNTVYNGNAGNHEFVGQIKRSVKLSSVLKILEASGVHFKIEGENLYIQP
ncbi:FecR family protein [Mucilaginibacter paludis]|uniref:Anti-FecI sigma factor, FecR n=1 Tax=Mucilaginibacter paludis DSM 18603 TaxID=714943 RepID=H1YBE8_9SPHI|nr:FecR family protein [Mucilaginibacter paludis]EHQ31202.1 anti-FecI sigma factor, FecR [Mucilaginibacter paludis DSM 18603]